MTYPTSWLSIIQRFAAGLKSLIDCLRAVQSWRNYLTSLRLSCFAYKIMNNKKIYLWLL